MGTETEIFLYGKFTFALPSLFFVCFFFFIYVKIMYKTHCIERGLLSYIEILATKHAVSDADIDRFFIYYINLALLGAFMRSKTQMDIVYILIIILHV